MSEAIFGLIGVVIGALAAGLGDYVLEATREARAVQRAARMLRLELHEASNFVTYSLDELRWIADPEQVLSNEVWVEHRAEFAGIKDGDLWDAVAGAFLAIAELRRANRGAEGVSLVPGDDRCEDAAACIPAVRRAIVGLDRYLD